MKSRVVWLLLLALLAGPAGCGKIPFVGKKKQGEGVHTEEVLKQALQDKNPMVRKDAVRVLGEMIDTPENQMRSARVLSIALKDRDEEIRLEAVKTLGAIEQAYSNRYLKDALNDRSVKVRMLVMQVIRQMNEKRIADAKQREVEKERMKDAEKEKEAAQPATDNPLLPAPQPQSGQ